MLALRLATYLLVCDGVASLFLAGLIGPLWAALVVLAMLGSWWLERARERGVVRASVAWGLVATSSVTFSVSFLFVFVSFLLLATWMLMLHHIVAETERADGPVGPASARVSVSAAGSRA